MPSNAISARLQDWQVLKKDIKEQLITGFVVVFDLADSTGVKIEHRAEPLRWLGTILSFYELILEEMRPYNPIKLLGDGIMFCFPDMTIPVNQRIYGDRYDGLAISAKTFFDRCARIVEVLEEQNTKKTPEDQYFIGITLDYGDNLYDLGLTDLGDAENPDFIGEVIDRAFRINSITGNNLIGASEQFFAKLRSEDASLSEKFEPIRINKGILKGIENDLRVHVYAEKLLQAKSNQNHRLINHKVLVEKEKLLSTKARIHLLKKIARESHG